MNGFPIRKLFSWLCYIASAAPFVVFVGDAFLFSGLGRESTQIVVVNAVIFAAAGVTAVLVKNMAFNAFMAFNAIPYAGFLIDHRGFDPAGWSSNDVEGSVIYVSLYCLLGTASTLVWLMMRVDAIWRWLRKGDLKGPTDPTPAP